VDATKSWVASAILTRLFPSMSSITAPTHEVGMLCAAAAAAAAAAPAAAELAAV
jgi:hypothetical protein